MFQRKNKQGGYFLGFLILALAYNGFETFLWSAGFDAKLLGRFIILFELIPPFVFLFGMGPSLYLYTNTIINPEYKLSRPVLVYYMPVWIQLLIRLGIILYALISSYIFQAESIAGTLDDWHRMLSLPVNAIVFWIYLLHSIQVFRRFAKNASNDTIDTPIEEAQVKVKWLKAMFIVMSITATVWVITILANSMYNMEGDINYFYPLEVSLAMLIYWIGYAGYHRTKIIHIKAQKSASAYINGLAPEEMENGANNLKRAMETDKLYLDAELTVSKLATHLQMTPKMISALLNGYLHKGFSEFVNEYRVKEVQEKMLKPENRHLTITGIALECGFNSQATFGRVFKSTTGLSPKEYLSHQTRKPAQNTAQIQI